MRTYNRLASMLFNTPLMVQEDVLDMGVSWANQAMNLNIVNLHMGETIQAFSSATVQAASPAEQRLKAANETGVYILPIHGALVSRNAHLDMCTVMTSYEEIRSQLYVALNDPNIAHIVLDIDSPGGSATGVFDLADEIASAKAVKPITAIVNFSAFSAAYCLASAATEIIGSASSGYGSIGVIARHVDLSKRYEAEGVKITNVYAGAKKNDLSSDAPLSEEALTFLQGIIEETYSNFVATVARNRGLTPEAVRNTEAGVFFGQKAIDAGLADKIEPPQAAINRIAAQVAAMRKPKQSYAARAAAMNLQNSI